MVEPVLTSAVTFFDRYGPYAFGLASLLLIWATIVAPEMERNRLSYDEQAKIVSRMEEIVDGQRQVAALLQKTVESLMAHEARDRQRTGPSP